MTDKPLNYRQSLFVKYYTGDNGTKGNCEASMLKAGYKPKYAHNWNTKILDSIGIKAAIEAESVKIEAGDVNSREFVTKEMLYQYGKNKDKRPSEAIRALENLGKNCGWYAIDNAQRTEQAKLDQTEAKEAKRIANILNLESIRKEKAG